MATLSKALNATVTVLSVTCFALYLAGMLTPFLKTDTIDSFIWGKMCPSGKAVGDKSCTKVDVCASMNSLMKASQAFFILSDIGALAAVAAGAGALLGKVPSVATIGAAAATFVFGTITVGVSFPVWTQKQCGQSMSYAKMDGVKMGPCLKLLIAAYVLSFAALAAAIASHVLGGGAAAQGAGDVSGAKQVDNGAPLRQEPPASTLVPVQAQESQNPLDKEQPKHEEPQQHQPQQHHPEQHHPEQHQPEQHQQEKAPLQPQHQQPTAAEQAQSAKRAKVLAIDFEELKRKLPATKGDEAQKAQRFAMFDRIDVQGKGALDVAEVTAGLRDVLQVGDTVASLDVVIAKAFAKAAAAGQAAAGNAGGEGAATVEKNEFRLLLLYVRQYFRVFQIFATIDATGDNRMALDEFRTAQPEFAAMGLKIADADATFHAIDADKSGVVDFHEFAMWALEQDGVLSG